MYAMVICSLEIPDPGIREIIINLITFGAINLIVGEMFWVLRNLIRWWNLLHWKSQAHYYIKKVAVHKTKIV